MKHISNSFFYFCFFVSILLIGNKSFSQSVKAHFTINTSRSICPDSCVIYTDASIATGTTIDTWTWIFQGGTPASAIGKGPHKVCYNSGAGKYDVELSIANPDQNFTDQVTEDGYITVDPVICGQTGVKAVFTPGSLSLCKDSCVHFENLSTGNINSYVWSFDGGIPSSSTLKDPPLICFPTAGEHKVQLYVSDPTGNNSDQLEITAHVKECFPPVAKFNIPQNNFCPGTCIGFIDSSLNDPNSYKWSFIHGAQKLTSDEKNPTNICYDTAGIYKVTLQVKNTKGSDETSMFVTVSDTCVTLKMPSAFSPNGDKKNDVFGVPEKVSQAGNLKSVHATIYNRWGQLVFEIKNLNDKWNGKLNNTGVEQPVGVYMYYLEATMNNGTTVNLKGNVTLIR